MSQIGVSANMSTVPEKWVVDCKSVGTGDKALVGVVQSWVTRDARIVAVERYCYPFT